MKVKLVSLALFAFFPQVLHAQETDIQSLTEEEQLLAALVEEPTAIATRTKMNADYVPGMVSVLYGGDLEARGARTVWEALALVPGMETAIEKTGRRKVLVRGLGNIWASGNVKILLNDVAMNSAELGLADPVFNLAIEQVDRIEVIRGPGSAIHGEFAYMGVINVITRSERDRVFGFGGSFETAGAGAVLAFTDPGAPVQASLNVAGWRSSGPDGKTGPDRALQSGAPAAFSNAPGDANEDVDSGAAVFKLEYQGFSLLAQWAESGLGDHFGINYYLPPDSDRVVERSRHRSVDARQDIPLTPALTLGIDLGWQQVQRETDNLFVRPDYYDPDAPDFFRDSRYQETNLHGGADVVYRGLPRHTVLLALNTSEIRVDNNNFNFHPAVNEAPVTVLPGTTRTVNAVTLQDEFRHSDLFTLTAGVRYDEYSGVGINYSPRIAGVWRFGDRHIVKAQYAEAFRPPTLYEEETARFYDQPDLEPATIGTSELGYIFKGLHSETKLTAFYSRFDDLVLFAHPEVPTGFFENSATSKGIEVEQRWRATRAWSLDGNVSYVDTRNEESDKPFPGAASWLGNAGVTYERHDFMAALQVHYVSGYEREVTDPRSHLDGYTTADLTGTFENVFSSRAQLRIGVKNLFDEDVRYPAPVFRDGSSYLVTYPDDYPRAGTSWWTQISYRY